MHQMNKRFEYETATWDNAGTKRKEDAHLYFFFAAYDVGMLELTEQQAAQLMGISLKTFQELEEEGSGPYREPGDPIRLEYVSNWIEGRINNSSAYKDRELLLNVAPSVTITEKTTPKVRRVKQAVAV